jgi:hypothetical protein
VHSIEKYTNSAGEFKMNNGFGLFCIFIGMVVGMLLRGMIGYFTEDKERYETCNQVCSSEYSSKIRFYEDDFCICDDNTVLSYQSEAAWQLRH